MKKILFLLFLIIHLQRFYAQMPYTFSALSGAYTPLAGATTVHASGVDESLSAAINIGFTFQYNCVNYTQVKISSNGWMTFSLALTGSGLTNNLDLGIEK
ncbi:MAG: hypothetical protein N3F09_10775, partial [Bacteroidia bacterium]|nr:hypothetical protein [Bacteroidia bacterium]